MGIPAECPFVESIYVGLFVIFAAAALLWRQAAVTVALEAGAAVGRLAFACVSRADARSGAVSLSRR